MPLPKSFTAVTPLSKTLAMILFILLPFIGFCLGIQYEKSQNTSSSPIVIPTPAPEDKGVACTMDAKLCPDGSSVGRIPPNCEFAPCPASSNKLFCGGIAGLTCPAGYSCKLDGNYPDAGGTCVSVEK